VLSLRVFLLICFVVYGGGVVVGSIIVWFDVASVETATNLRQKTHEATTRAEEEKLAEEAKLEGEQTQSAAEEEARLETERLAEEARLETARIGQEERLLAEETNKADEAEMKAEDAKLQKEETQETEEKAGTDEVHHPTIEQSRSEAARLARETSEQARPAETDAREAVARLMVGSEHDKKESWDLNDRPAGDDLNASPLMMEADIIAGGECPQRGGARRGPGRQSCCGSTRYRRRVKIVWRPCGKVPEFLERSQ
jgi:membrane protein involved in colicin uptake